MKDHYLEKSLMAGWSWLTGDVGFVEYGGRWYREIAPDVFHVVQLVNMKDACGDDSSYTYWVLLSEINLREVPTSLLNDAMESCGWEGMPTDGRAAKIAKVEMLSSYGVVANMGDWEGNNYRRLLRMAKRESREMEKSPLYRETMLSRPVNALGSTARELARGDIKSAMVRGVMNHDPAAKLCAKIFGASEELISAVETLGDEMRQE